jgi:hypothetical protein
MLTVVCETPGTGNPRAMERRFKHDDARPGII